MSEQGQSYLTEAKERGFTSALSINMKIIKPRATYFHFDLNAGGGMNEKARCIGSPLAFLAAAERHALTNFFGFFVDHDRDQVGALLSRPEIMGAERTFVVEGDNAAFISMIPHLIRRAHREPEYAKGSVLVDDNGTGVPIAELSWLAAVCPTLDIFINVTATGLKRTIETKGIRLADIVDGIAKDHWQIRKPLGQFQWTMLVARNFPVGDHKAEGFYHLNSPEGRALFRKANLTEAERFAEDQPRLL